MSDKPELLNGFVELVGRVPYFGGLDRLDVARLFGAMEPVAVPAGTTVVTEGETADALDVLAQGRVVVSVQTGEDERPLAVLDAPSPLVASAAALARRSATARALTAVQLWRRPRERFERLGRERPAVALAIATPAAGTLSRCI